MGTLLLKTMLIGILMGASGAGSGVEGALPAQIADGQSVGAAPDRPQPCYVVIAVDVSGSMENVDSPTEDSAGRRQTLRDEGQLICLQMLPFLRSELYVGVAHFSDRVRYGLPSAETGPLLPWGQTFLTESACRNMVRPAEFQASYRTDIAEGMTWASERIAAARRQHGPGTAKLIVLTNGDPRDSARELDRGRGPLLSVAKRFAEQQIQVYPVLIDGASFRSSNRPLRLSADDLAAEDLMNSVALMTGGRAYRLARDFGFPDILMDVFGVGMQVRNELLASRYDWAIVTVGEPVKSVTMEPAQGAGKRSVAIATEAGLEAVSGIRSNVITSPWHQTTILRRPDASDLVERYWQGRWRLDAADGKPQPTVRMYRIPEFLMELELKPELPWWRHEQVQAGARLLERHRRVPGSQAGAAFDENARELSIRVRAVSSDGSSSLPIASGRWALPARLYETGPFAIRTAGLYKLDCELRHAVGDVNVPILQSAKDVYVHSECVGIQVVNAATDAVLANVSPAAGATVNIALPGGQDVCLRISGQGEFKVEPLAGVLHLEPLDPMDWSLRKDEQGNLLAGPIHLVEREERLVGWAELDVRTHVGVRHIRLPRFELAYPPAPMEIACRFTDTREALWVGEFHRQPVVISAFPVFERLQEATLLRFPETLPLTRIRTVDMRTGTTQVSGPESRLLEPAQAGGYENRTITATYFVESAIPIPSADKCEIDLGPAMENLQPTAKTYAVVDPVAQGLFKWSVTQPGQSGTRAGAVSEVLWCGEPVQFHAEWRADQDISAVRFEFPQTDSNEPEFVGVPVTAGSMRADVEQVVAGLIAGQTLPVHVHVTMRPAGADRDLEIKLKAGLFRAEDRRVVLEDLTAGQGGLTDISAYTWEPVEIPLRAVFVGYTPTDARHNAAIEQFKKSCVVTVTSRTGDVRNVSETIEWTAVTSPEGPARRCELTGRAAYMPDAPGRVSVAVTAETPAVQGAEKASSRRAYAHLLAKPPRLAVTIAKLTPTGEEPVFDSRRWVTGEGGISALFTRFSARLRVDVRSSDWAATGQLQPWRTAIRLLRRPAADAQWVSEFSDAGDLTADGSFLREIQISGNGEYALEVAGYDSQSARRAAFFMTPVIAMIRPHETQPVGAPPAWLSSRVRQWPFEYRVTLHQEAGDPIQSQALAFQFQLPGQTATWIEGTTSAVPSQTPGIRQLLVRGPRFLPAAQGLQDGTVQFKLSSQGLDLLQWDCPDIRVVRPVLEGLTLSHKNSGDAIEPNDAELSCDGSAELWARPQLRPAPELEGRWTPAESTVYMWRHREGESAGRQVDVRTLDGLLDQARTTTARTSVRAFRIEDGAAGAAVRVMPRVARLRLLGWPRRPASERYSLVASVVYRPTEPGPDALAPMVAEWSDVCTVYLKTPWVVPLCWWPIVVILVFGAVMAGLRLLVPNPSRLPLDLRLEENVAIVEPTRLDNPVLVDLQETSFARDVHMYTRYLQSRWDGGLRGHVLACIAGPVHVLLRWTFYPRRWAWTTVIPRVRGNVESMQTGLMCVWTGLGARGGRIWSCRNGSQSLPEEGHIKTVSLDLPYRVDNVNRTIRVTVRIGRMARR